MSTRTVSGAVLAAALLMTACDPGPDPGSDGGVKDADGLLAPLLIARGHDDGTPGLIEIPDGSDVDLAAGAQGGFHVVIGVRVPGSLGQTVTLERQARRVDTGQLVSMSRQRADLVVSSSAAGSLETEIGSPLFLCPTPIGIAVSDQPLVVRIHAQGADGQAAEGTVRLVPRCPAAQAEFCRDICSG